MTEHEHSDADASKIVEQFGDEIRAAIQAVAEEAPRAAETVALTVAKRAAKAEMKREIQRTTVRWYLTSVFMTLVIAATVAWLMQSYAPRPHAADVTYERGFDREVCKRDNLRSTTAHPAFLCTTQ